MKIPVQLIISIAMVLTTASFSLAETSQPTLESSSPKSVEQAPGPATGVPPVPVADDGKKNWHVELGGSYSSVSRDNGSWKSLDLKVMYSGLPIFTPFASVANLTRREGSQQVYGIGSYINVTPSFYMIAGVSGAPVEDRNVVYYPRLRLDLMGVVQVPRVDGLVLTTGITDFDTPGGGGDIFAVGFMYYIGKAIFNAALNYNISRPGNDTSFSGQAGVMYGAQGSYYVGGGAATGRVAYQLSAATPLDVRYDSHSFNVFYQPWLGKNWGIIARYDYVDNVNLYELNGITLKYFVDF